MAHKDEEKNEWELNISFNDLHFKEAVGSGYVKSNLTTALT